MKSGLSTLDLVLIQRLPSLSLPLFSVNYGFAYLATYLIYQPDIFIAILMRTGARVLWALATLFLNFSH